MKMILNSTGVRWLWITIIVLFVDLESKSLILQNFSLGEEKPLFSFLSLYYVRNYGAAFNFLSHSGNWKYWFFFGITISTCITLLHLMYHSKVSEKLSNIAYSLIIGGALGNFFDRVWHGFVIDLIDFHVGDWHFAIFNFADSAIFIGVVLVLVDIYLPYPKKN